MRRNFQSSGFYSDGYDDGDDADPRVGLVNLADVMLVFACGLMISLVSHWGVNLSTVDTVTSEEMRQVDDVESMVEGMKSGSNGYSERGKVYQDPETGKLYLLEMSGDQPSEGKSE